MEHPSDKARLPLNALRAFETAARHLSFTRAAKELNVTQGAVSRQVKTLEDQLDTILFKRLHRSLALTDAGRELFGPVTLALDNMAEAVNTLKQPARDLNLKIHPTFAIRWLIPRLHRFQADHPEIQIRFTTSSINADFKHENFDMAVTYRGEAAAGVNRKRILEEQLTPVCSPKLLESGPPLTRPEDLAGYPLLHNSPDRREWRAWADQTGTSGLSFVKGQIFEIDDAALQAAVAGLGVALGDRLLIREDLESGRLTEPFEFRKVKTGTYYLSWPKTGEDKPGIKEFKAWLINEIEGS